MSKQMTIKEGLPHRNIAQLNKYLQEHGVSVSTFTVLKSSLIEIAAAVESNDVYISDPSLVERQNRRSRKFINPNPFSMKSRS